MVSTSQRGAIYVILGILILVIGGAVTVLTFADALHKGGIYAIWIGFYFFGSVLVVLGIIECCTGHKKKVGPA